MEKFEISDIPKDGLRKIRLFISSTFKDMNYEREALNSVVFPYIRKICAELCVEFTAIDLRWGITEEEAHEGKTVDICLAEVKNCYPFFIGIIADRYGWVPDDKYTLNYPNVFYKPISLTEAEIIMGTDFWKADTRAIICIRDSRFTRKLRYKAEKEQYNSLEELKTNIREKCRLLLDGYNSIDEFCNFIKEKLEAQIKAVFPSVAEQHEYLVEDNYQMFIMNRLDSDYLERQKEEAVIDEYALDGGAPLLVLGKTGSGKSALLAHWAKKYSNAHPDEFIFTHFCGTTERSSDWTFLVRRLLHNMSVFYKTSLDIPEQNGELIYSLPKFLSNFTNTRIFLVIDGIELLHSSDEYGLTWLPYELAEHVRLIISARQSSAKLLKQRNYRVHSISVLSRKEQYNLIDKYLPMLGKNLNRAQKRIVLCNSMTRTPIYLKTLLQELSLFGDFEKLNDRLTEMLEAKNTVELFELVILRLESSYNSPRYPNLAGEILCLLESAHTGLSENQILVLTNVPTYHWLPVYYAIQSFIIEYYGSIRLLNTAFRKAIRKKYNLSALKIKGYRMLIIRMLESYDSGNTQAVKELAWLYYETDKMAKLYSLLSKPDGFAAVSADMNSLKKYWALIETKLNKTRTSCEDNLYSKNKADFNIIYTLSRFFVETGFFVNARKALDAFIEAPVERAAGELQLIYGLLGEVEQKVGNYDYAITAYRKKLSLSTSIGDELEQARALGNLGNLHALNGNLDVALKSYEQAGSIFQKHGYMHGLQAELGNRGCIHMRLGEYDAASRLFLKRERICRESFNYMGLVSALGNLWSLSLLLNNTKDALRYLKEQEAICRRIGDHNQLQAILCNKAIQSGDSEYYTTALEHFLQSLEESRAMTHYDGEQTALYNLSVLYRKTALDEKALEFARIRRQICEAHNDTYLCAESRLMICELLQKLERKSEVETELKKLLIYCQLNHIADIYHRAKSMLEEVLEVCENG